MYSKIQQFKEDGLNKSQVAKKLKIDYKTVRKYWDMTTEEFANYELKTKRRRRKLDQYKDDILALLYKHNDYKVSQIEDRLKEKYPDEKDEIKYSTLRKYLKDLRKEYQIPKKSNIRQYQAVADPPLGYQSQLDLGVKKLKTRKDEVVKLYVIAMVLSNSRYKYVKWYDHPPNTRDLIKFHESAFQYFQGMPTEIVYDQDRLIIVDENYGDIIYTAEFETYRQQRKFNTYICRSRDPETKGRIERVVKYVKNNFAQYRTFTTIEEFNKLCWDWLERTGNTKVHGTTKKIPVEVFKREREYLKPVTKKSINFNSTENSITRNVKKDNTILFSANRYTVPIGTYKPGKEVYLVPIEDKVLKIIDKDTGEVIAEHEIKQGSGKLIKNNNHLRDYSQKIEKLYEKTLLEIGDNPTHKQFLDRIKQDKPRYLRDQYSLLIEVSKDLSQSEISTILDYCVENDFFSATDFKSIAENLDKLETEIQNQDDNEKLESTDNEIYCSDTEVRNLSEYEEIAR